MKRKRFMEEQCAFAKHHVRSDGFCGFDFNEDRDGVWFEGTGHMATAYACVGQDAPAMRSRRELCRAQAVLPEPFVRQEQPPAFQGPIGLVAGSHNGITTGFGFMVHKRLHVAATAWNVFAQLGFNPYFQRECPGP
jgi:hypothetical protein